MNENLKILKIKVRIIKYNLEQIHVMQRSKNDNHMK